MSDPLYAAIDEELSKPLDGAGFQLCAGSLLQRIFPALAPIRGGHDAGMDGYAGAVDAPPFVLVATTGCDASRNLRRNLQSYLKEGGKARRAIFATSQQLTGHRRLTLEKVAALLDFDLTHTFDRPWLVEALYREPMWRKKLLGLTGEAPALSAIPPSRRTSIPLPLLGRDNEVKALRSSTGDVLVTGKPGIGKTAILRQLVAEGWGLFVADSSDERLPDAIRQHRPSRIILDDAHFAPGRLMKLRQIRDDIDADFSIVAVTWPGARVDVELHLGSPSTFEIGPLTRPEIVAVIEHVGVKGPAEFQREIVDQAMGRPGLAATLALLALNGKAREVAVGEALLQDTEVTYRAVLGDESAAVLAVIALGGDAGVDMGTVAAALKLDLASTQQLVRGLASGGTIDEARSGRECLTVQPESLRYALVREMFFGGAASLPLRSILGTFEDPTIAVVPLVGATYRGAHPEPALLRSLVERSRQPPALAAYASLGQEEAEFALSVGPHHALHIARASLLRSPDLAFRLLMKLAVGDERPRHSHPDHPMRILKDYLADPSGMLEHRQRLVRIVSKWVTETANPDIALEALCCALNPGFETLTADPGLGHTVTIRHGILSLQALRQVARLWDQALDLIPVIRCQSYIVLLEVLGDWAYPSRVAFGAVAPEHESYQFMRRQAASVVRRLAKQLPRHRGVLARLSRLSTQAQLGVKVRTDQEFDVLFPTDELVEDPSGWKAVEQRQRDRARKLADSMRRLLPREAVARIVAAEREAGEAGINYPRMTVHVCESLAEQTPRPQEYVRAFASSDAPPDLLEPLLSSLARTRSRGWSQIVQRLLDHERCWWVAIRVCLTQPVGRSLRREAIRRCDGRLRNVLEALSIRDELDNDTIDGLLDHPNTEVARSVAIHLDQRIDGLPGQTRRKWEAAIARCPADDYWCGQILARRSHLLVRWVEGWLQRQVSHKGTYEGIPDSLVSAIANLSVESRKRLLKRVREQEANLYVHDLVAALVGDDEDLVATLFATPELRSYQNTALRGRPDPSWLKRATIALHHGLTAEQVVAACIGGLTGWSGSEADHWGGWVQDFHKLGRSRGRHARELSRAGVKVYSSMRDRAAEAERHEEIYGHS